MSQSASAKSSQHPNFSVVSEPDTHGIFKSGGTQVDCSAAVSEYVSGSDWRIKANANTGYSNAGLINNVAGKIIANYWLDEIYSPEEGKAHRNADVHIHDLDCLTGYCAGWSLRALLNEGFNGVNGRVSSRPPRHFREALGQMANFLGILQSEWAGAQAFSSFDTYLAPYVFADNLPFKEIKKAIRQFVYNLNVPARWGQSPFTNITLDITVPEDLENQFPTANDLHLFKNVNRDDLLAKAQQRDMGIRSLEDLTFKHFAPEMELIDIAYYEVMTEGDSTGQPFTFPIPTVNITEDFNWDSKVAAAIFDNTAKVGSSYFQNFVGSQWMKNEKGERVRNPEAYSPGAVRSMCCRLQLDLRELLRRGNGLFGSAEMTGSIGVVTINMARLGYRFKGDMTGLIAELDRLMDISKSTLEKKRAFIQSMYNRGLYPYTARYLPFLRNHFSTIGVNGMNEMVRNYTDDRIDITDESGAEMALVILDHMLRKCANIRKHQATCIIWRQHQPKAQPIALPKKIRNSLTILFRQAAEKIFTTPTPRKFPQAIRMTRLKRWICRTSSMQIYGRHGSPPLYVGKTFKRRSLQRLCP